MKWLWKREWKNDKKELLIQIVGGFFWPFLFFAVYKIRPAWLELLYSYIMQLPKELLALSGLALEWNGDQILYFLFLPVLLFNVWLVWSNGLRMEAAIRRDERYGSIYLMCNQMYTRRQLIGSKYLWVLSSTLAVYAVWNLLFFLLTAVGVSGQVQRLAIIKFSAAMFVTGSCVQVLFLSMVLLYTVYRQKQHTFLSDGVNLLIFGTLIVGNLYKIMDLILLLIERAQWTGGRADLFQKAAVWLRVLHWFSPLSWINPYLLLDKGMPVIAAVVCLLLSGLCAAAGIRGYENREL